MSSKEKSNDKVTSGEREREREPKAIDFKQKS
jgi:hypothetical protein